VATALSLATEIPAAFVRKEAKRYGSAARMTRPDQTDGYVCQTGASTAAVTRPPLGRTSSPSVQPGMGSSVNTHPVRRTDGPAGQPDVRDPSVTAVATVSLVAGLACTLVPAATARVAGIDAAPGMVRAVGLADLALAPGLYVGRPSWPWLLARAASNPAIAAVSLASARSRRARLLAASLAVATASDLRTVTRLRAAHR
jgi:hypothetical protein